MAHYDRSILSLGGGVGEKTLPADYKIMQAKSPMQENEHKDSEGDATTDTDSDDDKVKTAPPPQGTSASKFSASVSKSDEESSSAAESDDGDDLPSDSDQGENGSLEMESTRSKRRMMKKIKVSGPEEKVTSEILPPFPSFPLVLPGNGLVSSVPATARFSVADSWQVISTLPRDQFLVLYQHVARQVTADELKRMGNGGGHTASASGVISDYYRSSEEKRRSEKMALLIPNVTKVAFLRGNGKNEKTVTGTVIPWDGARPSIQSVCVQLTNIPVPLGSRKAAGTDSLAIESKKRKRSAVGDLSQGIVKCAWNVLTILDANTDLIKYEFDVNAERREEENKLRAARLRKKEGKAKAVAARKKSRGEVLLRKSICKTPGQIVGPPIITMLPFKMPERVLLPPPKDMLPPQPQAIPAPPPVVLRPFYDMQMRRNREAHHVALTESHHEGKPRVAETFTSVYIKTPFVHSLSKQLAIFFDAFGARRNMKFVGFDIKSEQFLGAVGVKTIDSDGDLINIGISIDPKVTLVSTIDEVAAKLNALGIYFSCYHSILRPFEWRVNLALYS